MNDKLTAIGEFIATMGTGLIEIGKIAMQALTMMAVLIGLAIAFALPAWSMLATALDFIYSQHPGSTIWQTNPPGTILYYLQKTGQGITVIWIGRAIYSLGANARHG